MNRTDILKKANEAICGDREQDYGNPESNFSLIANLWSAYLCTDISAVDVAMMMSLLKVARVKSGRMHEDNFVDGAGYFACAGEIAGNIAHNPIEMIKPNCAGTTQKAAETNPCVDEIPEWMKNELRIALEAKYAQAPKEWEKVYFGEEDTDEP